jgi:hypothetical protein
MSRIYNPIARASSLDYATPTICDAFRTHKEHGYTPNASPGSIRFSSHWDALGLTKAETSVPARVNYRPNFRVLYSSRSGSLVLRSLVLSPVSEEAIVPAYSKIFDIFRLMERRFTPHFWPLPPEAEAPAAMNALAQEMHKVLWLPLCEVLLRF